MAGAFKTLFQLHEEGTLDQISDSIKTFLSRILEADLPVKDFDNDFVMTQGVIGIIAAVIVGMICLPFGATKASIKACQFNTGQKLLKSGGILIVLMTSLSAILFIEVIKLSDMIPSI